jgi:hypothetical protein
LFDTRIEQLVAKVQNGDRCVDVNLLFLGSRLHPAALNSPLGGPPARRLFGSLSWERSLSDELLSESCCWCFFVSVFNAAEAAWLRAG